MTSITGRTLQLGSTLSACALILLTASSTAFAGGDKLEAQLFATVSGPLAIASGKAKWEEDRGRLKASIEVEDVRLLDKTTLTITMCGASAMVMLTTPATGLGFADLNLDSRNRDMVPACQAGHKVTVKATNTNGSETDILMGTLQ